MDLMWCGDLIMSSQRKQKGVALIAVLWVTAFLAAIASTVAHQSRTSLQLTKNRIDMLEMKQVAESAILLRVADEINSPSNASNSLGDLLIPSLPEGIRVQLSIEDEAGKIDLNSAPAVVIQSLFLEVGLDEDQSLSLTNAILDWRDEDEFTRANGAEDVDYFKAGYTYGSKDADFERIEELQLVYGMSAELFSILSPYLTVYTQDFGVNVSVASDLVKRVVSNAALLSQPLEDGELIEDQEEFTSLTQGYVYNVQAKATASSGVNHQLSAIVRIERGNIYEPFTVLKWVQK